MGQRLNISIRENNNTLASGYWHWGGYTDLALGILSGMMELVNDFYKEDRIMSLFSKVDVAVSLLEHCDCGILNDRNDGRMRIGRDQDMSEGNIIVDLETKNIKLINIINEYGQGLNDTIFEFSFLEAQDYIKQIVNSEDDFELDGKEYFKIA